MALIRDLLSLVTCVLSGLVEHSDLDAVHASDIYANKVGTSYVKGLEADDI